MPADNHLMLGAMVVRLEGKLRIGVAYDAFGRKMAVNGMYFIAAPRAVIQQMLFAFGPPG